jgi:hypothetical protein
MTKKKNQKRQQRRDRQISESKSKEYIDVNTDVILKCKNCHDDFSVSAAFYARNQQQYKNTPISKCKPCRDPEKAKIRRQNRIEETKVAASKARERELAELLLAQERVVADFNRHLNNPDFPEAAQRRDEYVLSQAKFVDDKIKELNMFVEECESHDSDGASSSWSDQPCGSKDYVPRALRKKPGSSKPNTPAIPPKTNQPIRKYTAEEKGKFKTSDFPKETVQSNDHETDTEARIEQLKKEIQEGRHRNVLRDLNDCKITNLDPQEAPLSELTPEEPDTTYTRERHIDINDSFVVDLTDDFPDILGDMFETEIYDALEARKNQLLTQTKTKSLNGGSTLLKPFRGVWHKLRRKVREWRFNNSDVENILKKYYKVERKYTYSTEYMETHPEDHIDLRPARMAKVEILAQTYMTRVKIVDRLVLDVNNFNLDYVTRELGANKSEEFMGFFQKINKCYLSMANPCAITLEEFIIDPGMLLNLVIIDPTLPPDLMWASITSSMKSGIVNSDAVDRFTHSTDYKTSHLLMAKYYSLKQHMKMRAIAYNVDVDCIPEGYFQLGSGRRGLLGPNDSDPSTVPQRCTSMDTTSMKHNSNPRPSVSTPQPARHMPPSIKLSNSTPSIPTIARKSTESGPCQSITDQTSEPFPTLLTAMTSLEKDKESRSVTKTPSLSERSRSESFDGLSSGTSVKTISIRSIPTPTSQSTPSSVRQTTLSRGRSSLETLTQEPQSTTPDCPIGFSNCLLSSRTNSMDSTNTQEGSIRVPTRLRSSSVPSSSKLRRSYSPTAHSLRKCLSETDQNTYPNSLLGATASAPQTTHPTRDCSIPNS